MRAGRHDGRRRLYLDFDGYFAAVEEQAAPALHGRPVAVLPYEGARTCVISSNAEAKRHGVGTGTGVDEARRRCPGIRALGVPRIGDIPGAAALPRDPPWSASARTSTCGCSAASRTR